MTIKDFDYKGFAENLAGQAADLVPKEFNDAEKEYVTNTLLNFSTIAGEALYQDPDNLGFNVDQATMITQIIAEWSFHKSVDLIRSGIPQQFWDPIMQKIAFTIFEISKQTFKQGLPQDQILQLIEHHVKKTYLDSIAELKEKGYIDEGLMEKAAAQSNIDAVMQQMENSGEVQLPQQEQGQQAQVPAAQEAQVPAAPGQTAPPAPVQAQPANIQNVTSIKYEPPKLLKLVTVAMLLKRMEDEDQVQEILECFDQTDAGTVIRYMYTDGIEGEMNPNMTSRFLDEIAKTLPEATEVSKKQLIKRVQDSVDAIGRNIMERKLQLERHKVRQFVFNAVEGEYYKISPRIANIIARYLESIV
ncbi:hypothetical protein IKP85_02060 [bacterium]|nr:hypothetical protein [bacterium]